MKTKVVCINLLRRPDRKSEVIQEFTTWGLNIEDIDFFEAVDNPGNGMAGLHQTMINVFAKYAGQQILVFEDDVRLYLDYNYFRAEEIRLSEAGGWFIYYLGGNATAPVIGTRFDRIRRVKEGFLTTHAVLYSGAATEYLSRYFQMPLYVDRTNTLDVWLAENIQPNFPCYVAFPAIASQKWGYSDICKFETNYDYFYNKSLKFYK